MALIAPSGVLSRCQAFLLRDLLFDAIEFLVYGKLFLLLCVRDQILKSVCVQIPCVCVLIPSVSVQIPNVSVQISSVSVLIPNVSADTQRFCADIQRFCCGTCPSTRSSFSPTNNSASSTSLRSPPGARYVFGYTVWSLGVGGWGLRKELIKWIKGKSLGIGFM